MQIILRFLRCILGFFAGNGGLTITTIAGPRALTPCGSAEWQVRWGLNVPNANGWIIQHVRFEPNVRNCEGAPVAGQNNVIEYWEGWRVVNGAIQVGFTGNPHRSDTFRTANQGEGTQGTQVIRGRVRFISGYNLTVPPWGYTFPQAGALPTLGTAPAGWTPCGSDKHILEVNWRCCPEGRVTTDQTGTLEQTGFLAFLRRIINAPIFLTMMERPAFDPEKYSPEANKLIGVIAGMPAWADLTQKDQQAKQQILNVAFGLLEFPLETVREAFAGYIALSESLENSYDVSAMSRLYVLNRFLFQVPAKTEANQPRFGSFAGVPANQNSINELWPLSEGSNGLELSGNFQGYYGEAYLALAEFDQFREQYGPRNGNQGRD